jgi:hypothetical protein
MFRKETVEIVSNGVIGRRLLNVREAAQYLGLEVSSFSSCPKGGRTSFVCGPSRQIRKQQHFA